MFIEICFPLPDLADEVVLDLLELIVRALMLFLAQR